VARQVEAMRSALLAQRNGSRLQYLDALNTRLRAEREQQAAAEQLPALRQAMRSTSAERDSFVAGWRRDVSEKLVAARTELSDVAGQLAKASRLNALVVVRAAEAGVVLDVARLSPGSVLREAEPLLRMIPGSATLIAEVTIPSADVGDLTPGSAVEVKVDAFPYQRHGLIKGRLLSVGEESFPAGGPAGSEGSAPAPGGVGAFHRARVALLSLHLHGLPPGALLFPGMTLTAEIKVGTRSAMSYFISPLTRGFDESLREP
jgi:HlyD family secretion protein